ncbi:hypothetical protein Hdeb2414_s0115g00800311 [Helianthus debilis subsp. tardiflorus]
MLRSESSLDQKIENPNDLIRSLSTLSSYSRHRQAPPHRNPSLHRTGIHRSTAPESFLSHLNHFFHTPNLPSFTSQPFLHACNHLSPPPVFFHIRTLRTDFQQRW